EFQGARQRNIIDVYNRYKKDKPEDSIKAIVLIENYRSSQEILNQATKLSNHNQERLINSLKELDLNKNIRSAADRFKQEENPIPTIKAYYNKLHEDVDILLQIEALQQQGVALSNVAILYSQHKQVKNLTNLMERKKIPIWIKKPHDVLTEPLVMQILNIFRYIHAEQTKSFSGEAALFEMMHNPF